MSGRSGQRTITFDAFDGGVNYWEEEGKLGKNESPEMVNLWWEGGGLCARPGQVYVTGEVEGGVGYAASPEPFWDRTFLHISSSLYCLDHTADLGDDLYASLEELCSGVPRNRGTFFRYGECLYYKNRGGFYQIAYTPEGEKLFTVTKVENLAYTPTILLNASPVSGSGDLYQPENRLTGRQRVKYTPEVTEETVSAEGDGAKRIFSLGVTAAENLQGVAEVWFGACLVRTALYECNPTTGTVTFTTAPEAGSEITFVLDVGLTAYKLPLGDLDAVEEVRVNGTLLSADEDYTVDLVYGKVTFSEAPEAEANGVEIVLRKENAEAKASVMSCRYAGVYGSGVEVCMVLGGCEAQPNAVFWNGNNDAAMDPGYFPVSFYNLCGDSAEEVTGFGRQYTDLIIFKERSIGKAGFGVEQVNGRDSISLTYQRVNDKIGCDLPWSIQLIENNLVFANSALGVFTLLSSSAAYENNVSLVSRNVNGSGRRPGLLYDLRVTGGKQGVSFDDGQHYWLCVNGHAYVWDYLLSSAAKPCWFYFTAIAGESWWKWGSKVYHLSGAGRVSRLGDILSDYDAGIEKSYRFPALRLEAQDRTGDILRLALTVRGDRESCTRLLYETENGSREDGVPIRIAGSGIAPRDLSERDLSVETSAVAALRKPLCRRVGRFSLKLYNDAAGQDLTMLSLRIAYRSGGRLR